MGSNEQQSTTKPNENSSIRTTAESYRIQNGAQIQDFVQFGIEKRLSLWWEVVLFSSWILSNSDKQEGIYGTHKGLANDELSEAGEEII